MDRDLCRPRDAAAPRHSCHHEAHGPCAPPDGRHRKDRAGGRDRLVGRDLFSGRPDWKKLLNFQRKPLSARERAFLNGPVEELCAMVDEWTVEKEHDLPPEAWRFIKEKRFFGMIIPKEYGGLGFSALANSAVVTKISSRSGAAAVTV